MTQAQQYLSPTEEQLSNARKAVQRFAAEWQNPVADNLRSLMHEDTRNLIPLMTEPADREGVVEHFRQVLTQLPDSKVDVLQWAPTGDAVMIEWRASATVAGQPLSWQGVDRFNLRGDRMYKGQVYWDTRRVAEQVAEAVKRAQQNGSAS
ncbi:nuclear transport factor 2 family protein [Paraburkholderia sp. BL21I4N1]|uniref:nuclear transport factor 2 family protein n=1 Tax=Paraburkholderia sp. BL21I4N1 TaxID=1938801 RepID=UPI000CFD3C2A|nr:nuclear transport factor 2 family protein [Paraburkholderia sp. BL21I4N1]PQV46367.1 SnoaL-like protein [Paraburkholderia sp. BL21I4N1]